MLRLTEEEIRDTMKLYAIDRGLINLVVDELKTCEDQRTKGNNKLALRVCRTLLDGQSLSAREIADNLDVQYTSVQSILQYMILNTDRVGRLRNKKLKRDEPVLWYLTDAGIEYIRKKEERGH